MGMAVEQDILNDAMSAYVQTFSRREILNEHLMERGLQDSEKEISLELDGLISAAETYLWTYPGGVPWTEEFRRRYREYLLERYSWMNESSFNRILGFSRWICWHDGLNADQA